MQTDLIWWVAALGAATLGAMGVGGGTLLVVYLALFTQLAQKDAQLQNLIFFLPLGAASLYFHHKNGMVRWRVALAALLPGLAGVAAGFWVSSLLDDFWLRKGFAVFLLAIGVKALCEKSPEKSNPVCNNVQEYNKS